MSKFLRTAGTVVAVAGSLALAAGTLGAGSAATAALLTKIGTIASAAGVAASTAGALLAKRPTNERQGAQLSFKIEPGGPIPLALGRTAVGGTVVHRETYGKDNHFESWAVCLTKSNGGAIEGVEAFTADRAVVPFSATAATGYYSGWMWQDQRFGASPETALVNPVGLTGPFGAIPALPGWGSAYPMSGYAGAMWTLLFDTKARRYANGEPDPLWVVEAVRAYDPRLDSTYPGGEGDCRWADPSDIAAHAAARATWPFTETPGLLELMWHLGIWERDETDAEAEYKRVMGVGAPIGLIDVAAFVNAANVQEANGWKAGGEVTSAMDKWDVAKLIAQAGGAEPIANGARLSTLVKVPRVSLATVTAADLADGPVSVPAMRSRRERINGFRPRFRSEAHLWEMVSTNLVEIAALRAEDGAPRTGSGDYPLVQDATQAAQLAAYEIYDGREITPITLILKPWWAWARIGDCVTLAIDQTLADGFDAIVRGRSIDPATGKVTLTLAKETAGKHAVALAQAGVVTELPTLPDPEPELAAPDVADWALEASADSIGILFTGAVGNTNALQVIFSYRADGDTDWIGAGSEDPGITTKVVGGLQPGTDYEGSVQYLIRGQLSERLILAAVTTESALFVDGAIA